MSYPYNKEIIFDYRSKEPLKDLSVLLTAKQLFRITVYRSVIGSGHWLKVGKLPLREDLLPLQLQYIHHSYGNIEYEIYNPMTGQLPHLQKMNVKDWKKLLFGITVQSMNESETIITTRLADGYNMKFSKIDNHILRHLYLWVLMLLPSLVGVR